LETVLGKLIAMSPQDIRQRDAISNAYYDGRLQRVLDLPDPSLSKSSERRDDAYRQDPASDSRQLTGQSLRKETHAFSEDDSGDGERKNGQDTGVAQDAGKEEEDSRYQHKDHPTTVSRRTSNRFESLGHDVQYILSDSDEMEELQDGDSDLPTSHARKRRQLEPRSPRPTLPSKASKKSYWASKGQIGRQDS